MNERKVYYSVLIITIFLQISSISLCLTSNGTEETICDFRIDASGMVFMEGCGCPINTQTYQKTAFLRSSLVTCLSMSIRESLEEEKLLFFLQRGGYPEMKKSNVSDGFDPMPSSKTGKIPLRVKRVREKIDIAKKLIYDQELSSKLEHLSIRKKLLKKSNS
ncbi:MAG: hypothetical protein ACE5OP_08915 [Candidatus Glassbacteria bacterium]